MSLFIVRIELHDAAEEEYEVLHKAMAKSGFARTVVDTHKVEFRLPHGEYGTSSDLKPVDIVEVVKKAARKTKKHFSILVTEAHSVNFYNLTPIGK